MNTASAAGQSGPSQRPGVGKGSAASSTSDVQAGSSQQGVMSPATSAPKKKRHRAGKKHKRKRRPSFAAPSDITEEGGDLGSAGAELGDIPEVAVRRESFYRLGQGRKVSSDSLESEALLDHRQVQPNFVSQI